MTFVPNKKTDSGSRAQWTDDEVCEYCGGLLRERTQHWRQWHRELSGDWHMNDIDGVMHYNGSPVFVIELTRVSSEKQLNAVLHRIRDITAQGKLMVDLATKYFVEAYIIAVFEDIEDGFFLYNLSQDRGWLPMSKEKYIEWEREKRCIANQ